MGLRLDVTATAVRTGCRRRLPRHREPVSSGGDVGATLCEFSIFLSSVPYFEIAATTSGGPGWSFVRLTGLCVGAAVESKRKHALTLAFVKNEVEQPVIVSGAGVVTTTRRRVLARANTVIPNKNRESENRRIGFQLADISSKKYVRIAGCHQSKFFVFLGGRILPGFFCSATKATIDGKRSSPT